MQTLAAAGEVAASMAHEIGSPLNVILGRTRMVRMREGVPPELAHELDTIVAQTERITRIVERFLRVSRPIGAMHIENKNETAKACASFDGGVEMVPPSNTNTTMRDAMTHPIVTRCQ